MSSELLILVLTFSILSILFEKKTCWNVEIIK
jgi:hypothetical protein